MFLIRKKVRHRLIKANKSHAQIKANTSRMLHSKLKRQHDKNETNSPQTLKTPQSLNVRL